MFEHLEQSDSWIIATVMKMIKTKLLTLCMPITGEHPAALIRGAAFTTSKILLVDLDIADSFFP